jgi:phage baseplate assembly protein W
MAEVPHFAIPFRFEFDTSGVLHAAVNEQDTIEDVTACVEAIVRTPIGYREELPDFGIRDQTFTEGMINSEEILVSLQQWEPRAEVLIEEDPSMLDRFIAIATLTPSLVNAVSLDPSEQEPS